MRRVFLFSNKASTAPSWPGVISDTATEDMVLDFNLFMTPQRRLSYGRLLAHLAVHPQWVPGLLRFHRQTLFAAKQLASALARVLES